MICQSAAASYEREKKRESHKDLFELIGEFHRSLMRVPNVVSWSTEQSWGGCVYVRVVHNQYSFFLFVCFSS